MSSTAAPLAKAAAVESRGRASYTRLERLLELRHVLALPQLLAGVCLTAFSMYQQVSPTEKLLTLGLGVLLAFSAASLLLSRSRVALGLAWLLVAAASYGFIARLDVTHLVHGPRLFKVGLGLALVCWILIWVLKTIFLMRPLHAAAVGYALTGVLFVAESIVPVLRPDFDVKRLDRDANLGGHPVLGWVNVPNGRERATFPDNPRGYFRETGPGAYLDLLSLGSYAFDGSSVTTAPKAGKPETLRVEVDSPETVDYHVCNLTVLGYRIAKGQTYHLNFDARADAPREIYVEVGQAQQPWATLGLTEKVALTPEWQSFKLTFSGDADELNARLKFNVGKGTTDLELRNISFDAPRPGEGATEKTYYLDHPTNSLGFRDKLYDEVKPPGVFRVVFLGDSFTFGMGVREEDIFLRKLEKHLNEQTEKPLGIERYEALNFGVNGYGTPQERLCYEVYGSKFHPDLVVLTMVSNDNLTQDEEIRLSLMGPRSYEKDFYLTRWAREMFLPQVHRSYEGCVPELIALDQACRHHGAALVVMVFRHKRAEDWQQLADTISAGLAGTDIPYLDLGETLLKDDAPRDLLVHPLTDHHPNEIGHAIAADVLEKFLRERQLLSRHE